MNETMHWRLDDDPPPDELLAFEQASRRYTAQRIDPEEFLARVHSSNRSNTLFQRILRFGTAVLRFAKNRQRRNSGGLEPDMKLQIERESVLNWLEGERPSTVTYLYCSMGSGKTHALFAVLAQRLRHDSRPILVIDSRGGLPYESVRGTLAERVRRNSADPWPLVLIDGLDEPSEAGGLTRAIHGVSPFSPMIMSWRERVKPIPDIRARVVDVRPYLLSDPSASGMELLWDSLISQAEAARVLRTCTRQGRTMSEALDRILAELRTRYETVPGGFVSQTRHGVRFHVSRTVCAERFTDEREDVLRFRTDSRLRESILDNKRSLFAAFGADQPGWVSTRVDRLDIEQLSMVMSLLDPTYQTSAFMDEDGA